MVVAVGVLVLLHAVPWWRLVLAPDWPTGVTVAGSVVALLALVGFPLAMIGGHGRRHLDGLAVAGDVWLGVLWQLFVWSVLGAGVSVVLAVAGIESPTRERGAAIVVLALVVALCSRGAFQALRIPRVRRTEIVLDRLGPALDGLTVVLLADTHYGPIERSRWSARTVDRVNALNPDVVVHAGDLADGSVEQRRHQVQPLAKVTARMARVYSTGNHEYFSGAVPWVEHMAGLGWTVLHNSHIIIGRDRPDGSDHLVIAGVDDLTAASSGTPGHRADLHAALVDAPPDVPVLLVAHQPKQIRAAVGMGVDLQLSGHTHGGQMWPFHLIVRAEQGALQGLSRRSERTQLYITRGAGFWGPPFRIFAPNEISHLTLRSAALSRGKPG